MKKLLVGLLLAVGLVQGAQAQIWGGSTGGGGVSSGGAITGAQAFAVLRADANGNLAVDGQLTYGSSGTNVLAVGTATNATGGSVVAAALQTNSVQVTGGANVTGIVTASSVQTTTLSATSGLTINNTIGLTQSSSGVLAVGTGAAASTAGTLVAAAVQTSSLVVTGNATVTNTLTAPTITSGTGSVSITGNLLPTTGSSYNLGTGNPAWVNLFLTGAVSYSSDSGLSRAGVPASVAVGNGTAGSTTGAIVAASYFSSVPTVISASSYTVATTDSSVVNSGATTLTITLPPASATTGRLLDVRTITAATVVSASANIVPITGGAAGTAILAATQGKWVTLQSTGSNYQIIRGN